MKLFHSATLKLTLWYLAIIMLISIAFSCVIYQLASVELNRTLVPPELLDGRFRILNPEEYESYQRQRVLASNARLILNLLLANLATLLAGGAASYFLARRTLQPIRVAMNNQARFTSDASHELRTPLAVMQSENEVALRQKKLRIDQAKDIIASNLEEVLKLRALTDRLLRLSSEERIELTPVSLELAAIDACERVIPVAQTKHITVDNMIGADIALVRGNQDALADLMSIILDNAIKYSKDHTTITLSAYDTGHTVLIDISDEGHGIDADDLPNIFDRFYRADTSRAHDQDNGGGHGLGLSIARRITDMHDGTISAGSRSDGKPGSVFRISLNRAS